MDILVLMSPGEFDREDVHRELERVVSSAGFARNERMSRFLRFLVEQHLEGKSGELKESLIGVEVFGRRPDYDPKQDAIVRTEASRLRARLSKYYAEEGRDDQLAIELPKGGYVPVFRQPGRRKAVPISRRFLWTALAGVCLAIALTAAAWTQFHQRVPIPIAVLPLINLSQDPANEYFTDGLTSEIIRNLSILDGLAVRSQTSSFTFKGKTRNVREAGDQLNAEYILEGSVLRAEKRLRVNAQLVRVRDDFPIWACKYDRELTDIFAIQDEISRGIVNSLRLKLGRGQRRYETSVEAYDLYLRARSLETQPALSGINTSVGAFEQAAAKDPSFAPAFAGLAAAHAARSGFDEFDAVERAREIFKGWAAVETAIRLDPLSPEAHDALGMMQAREAQWAQADRSFRRAVELAPGDPLWRDHFAVFLLLPLGRIDEAIRQLRIAEKADPFSREVHFALRVALTAAGRDREVETDCLKTTTSEKARAECTLLRQGKFDEIVRIQEARWHARLSEPGAASLGVAYARAGLREDAERVAAIVPRPLSKAIIFAALGDKDRTFEALDRAIPLGPIRMGRDVLINPVYAFLRGDPRLDELRRIVGLPE